MKKKILLLVGSSTIVLLIALGLIRRLAPGLIGIAPDLYLVNVSKEVPPFYENIFRQEDFSSETYLLNDPYMITRAKPLFPNRITMGPNDILGFRNRAVPNVADIITIGDSQTYGNNVPLELNWPSRLEAYISGKSPVIYNMSTGSWGGPHYVDIFDKAIHLKPCVVVVAFYTGNDPIDAFKGAYGSDHWKDFRLAPTLRKEDVPQASFSSSGTDEWEVFFRDGSSTVFTPKLRLLSNLPDHPAVKVAYRILAETSRRIGKKAREHQVPIVFTIIPSKELVYARRTGKEGLQVCPEYQKLVSSEKRYLAELADVLRGIGGAVYVDLLSILQDAAMTRMLYPPSENGHPIAVGYDIIAQAVAPALDPHISKPFNGLMLMPLENGQMMPVHVENKGYWFFTSIDLVHKNGWKSLEGARVLDMREMNRMIFKGWINKVDPDRFGPEPRWFN